MEFSQLLAVHNLGSNRPIMAIRFVAVSGVAVNGLYVKFTLLELT